MLEIIGNVIELPENEVGMGSELVSCMPGFIASMFDVVCTAATVQRNIDDSEDYVQLSIFDEIYQY